LRVEAEIVRGGSLAGLAAYESWLADRGLDDGYLLRRIARASLWELVARTESSSDALQELAADGDAEARAELARRMMAKGFVETRALARIGDEGAIKRLISQVQTGEGSKMYQIDALVQSKSPLAIGPLMKLLNDTNYPDHVAAAADGLGILNATQAIPELQKIYQEYANSPVQSVRAAAAFGLFRLGDMTGINLLQQKLASDTPYIALDTARRMASRPDAAWHEAVRGGLSNPDPAVRIIAAELIAPYDVETARHSLETLLSDSNPAIRALAGKIMASRVATDFRMLRRFFRSEEWQIRLAAAGRVLELSR
jgi:HEAT repeat protein